MSFIVYPIATLPRAFTPRNCTPRLAVVQRSHASPYGGSEQVIDLLNDRWMLSLDLPPCNQDEAGAREAYIGSLRGMANTTPLYHFGCPVPRGTLRGAPTAQAALQGASSITLNCITGETLKAGDMLGVAGLLLQVAADCVGVAGSIVVPLVNRLRTGIAAGAAVTWDRPTAPFRLSSQSAVQYVPGYAEAVSFDFVEDVA